MPLQDILNGSWKDYKRNFRLILKTYWWLDIFPKVVLFSILGFIFLLLVVGSAPDFGASSSEELTDTLNSLNPFVLTRNTIAGGDLSLNYSSGLLTAIAVLMTIVIVFSMIWLCLTLYYSCFYNGKGDLSFKRAAKGGISFFWKFLGLAVFVLLVIIVLHLPASLALAAIVNYWAILDVSLKFVLVLLCAALFIITFIFSIYITVNWSFSPYVLIKEREGVLGSLRKSKEVVSGRWWRVLGYILLVSIVSAVIYWLFSTSAFVTASLVSMLTMLTTSFNLITLSVILHAIGTILAYLLGLIGTIITVPFAIFFFKNLYLEVRKGKKRVKKVKEKPRKARKIKKAKKRKVSRRKAKRKK